MIDRQANRQIKLQMELYKELDKLINKKKEMKSMDLKNIINHEEITKRIVDINRIAEIMFVRLSKTNTTITDKAKKISELLARLGFDKPMFELMSLVIGEELPYLSQGNISLKAGTMCVVLKKNGTHDYQVGSTIFIGNEGDRGVGSNGNKGNRLPLTPEEIKDGYIRLADDKEIALFIEKCDWNVIKYMMELI